MLYRLTADLVLIVHAVYIAFVIVGLLVVLIGAAAGWNWVRNRWFRLAHLLAILLVVVQAYADVTCPLTTLENVLRGWGGEQPNEAGGFIATWLHRLIFFQAEPWFFTLIYTLFGLLVAVTLILIPPRWRGRDHDLATNTTADATHRPPAPTDSLGRPSAGARSSGQTGVSDPP